MEVLNRENFESAKEMVPTLRDESKLEPLSPEKIEEMLAEMESPVKFQKELAVKIKVALDHQMQLELKTKGILSDHTRRWVDTYTKILDRMQSAIHGDKSVNLHLHKVSHSDISTKIRESHIEVTRKSES